MKDRIVSIEKAILADVCLGVPLGKIIFSAPAHADLSRAEGPDTFLFRGEQLKLMKTLADEGDKTLQAAIASLSEAADAAMADGPFSVTEKAPSQHGGDPRDYLSLAKYWHPNPASPDGLPYVLKDGDVNPECYSAEFDYLRFVRFSEVIVLLALAAYLSGKKKYGVRAALLAKTWFLDASTRQNPTFAYAQIAPGSTEPRWQGIIEARHFIYVCEALQLLAGEGFISVSQHANLKTWFKNFLGWLRESEQGKRASAADNNIGLWYDLQCMAYARFSDQSALAEDIATKSILKRIDSQIALDGAMPRELSRAYPQDYVAFSLVAMAMISRMGEETGLNLWTTSEGDGRNFQAAHDWLLRAGKAGELASTVSFPTTSDDEPSSDFGLALDLGLKMRAVFRAAEMERNAGARLRAEITAREHFLEKAQRDALAQTAMQEKELAKTQETLARIRTELTARKADAKRERQRADNSQAQLIEAIVQSHAQKSKIASLNSTINALHAAAQAEVARAQEAHQRAEAEAAARAHDMAVMRASTSWRVTAPLRALKQGPAAALKRRLRARAAIRAIAASPLFDAQWYLTRYPDLRAAGVDPVRHYVLSGAAEGRDPGPGFSTRWYREAYPDIAANSFNPLHHYITHGRDEGRAPLPAASGDWKASHASPELTPEQLAIRDARRHVGALKDRILKLGFFERGLAEMRALAERQDAPVLRACAAWELAVILVNLHGEDNAREALALLEIAAPADPDDAFPRRSAVMRAEAEAMLGDFTAAQNTLTQALKEGAHADLYLAMASLAADNAARLDWINRALELHSLQPTRFAERTGAALYDRLSATAPSAQASAKVSIIIPAYNARATIGTAIESLLAQSWANLEILVCDDCSEDNTREIVTSYSQRDSRVKLITAPVNAGPYVARNLALKEATGDFVTCNDSDDWSHPRKIEIQARHLLENAAAIANTSPQARTSEDLIFSRRGNPGFYIQPNMSSLMFRRQMVVERIGYWDSVRFAADSEYTRRIKKVFGANAIVDLDVGPLSFQRQTETSLTGSASFGYHGYKMGARREYEEAHKAFHAGEKKPFIDFPLTNRPFLIPEPMRPQREKAPDGQRHFDVVLVSDFRMPGGTTMSNAEEIKAQRRFGLRTGLVQMSRYDMNPQRPYNTHITSLIDGDQVDMIVCGEKIVCDLLILRLPWVLEEWQSYIPHIEAKTVKVIVNQPPKRDYGDASEVIYHIPRCAEHMKRYFGDAGTWHPIGPLVREALELHHNEDLNAISFSEEDWTNIIDVDEWRKLKRPERKGPPRIGRHARDHAVKWPATADDILTVYPATKKYEVCMMGGAKVAKGLLGEIPDNWRVLEFNEVEPWVYLSMLDVFVYYTHPDWVESFGRVIIEAMAAGTPVVLPPAYRPLFGEAALYAAPQDALKVVDRLMDDKTFYERQSALALETVMARFSYDSHFARIEKLVTPEALKMLSAVTPRDEPSLKREYVEKGLDKAPDTFVLYRIIGNDLYPRHQIGQSRANVSFLLEHEPELEGCEKRWILNRIVNAEEESRIIEMLEARDQDYLRIPFVAEDYLKIDWDLAVIPSPGYLASEAFRALDPELQLRLKTALYRLKNNYLMNNNGARNTALRDGRARAKWVLPWDGNCFVSEQAWSEIVNAVHARPHLKYFVTPMERITDNKSLLRSDFIPRPAEEPQILFRRDAVEEFNPDFPYGRRPKVELFWRLEVPGPWDRWRDDLWDQHRRPPSPEAGHFGVAGWVARMFSGVQSLEQEDKASFKNRGLARQEAIVSTIDHVDRLVWNRNESGARAFYTDEALNATKAALQRHGDGELVRLGEKIIADAEKALRSGPYSVIDKTTLPPSGDPHDYWHPAPYWWPDPEKPDGLPYIRKDGQRVPGTHMYEPTSKQYDRTRLQLMFDNTSALAIGWRLTGRADFAEHGAKLVRTWFLDPSSRMNPHLRYAQVRRGHNNDEGAPTGIIEFKDFYYFLDAVRLLEHAGAFNENDSLALKAWLRDYLDWLADSPQGRKEAAAANNHGTYFDLQEAAILSYIGEGDRLRDVFLRSVSRISAQFTANGDQPEEMTRSITQHYCFFNLQGWLNILLLARAEGFPLPDFNKEPYSSIVAAFDWVLGHDMARWPYEQIEPFDTDRAYALALAGRRLGLRPPARYADSHAAKPILDPHDAVLPYWNLSSVSTGGRISHEAATQAALATY